MICSKCNIAFGWSETPNICVSCEKKALKQQVKDLKQEVRELKAKVHHLEANAEEDLGLE